MNIEMLDQYIKNFEREIVESGFKRDLDDYVNTLPSAQNNILQLRDITNKVTTVLTRLYSSDLPSELKNLLPAMDIRPFTEYGHHSIFQELINNNEITQADFFNQLNQHLSQLRKQIQQNQTKIQTIKEFITPYISRDLKKIAEDEIAIISIVFHNHKIITNLKEFTKTLHIWNRDLPVYHQLLTSDPPKEIEIIDIQNGSIDLIINLNVDVAVDLIELFKLGFQVFGAYLAYKKMFEPIIETFHGNEKLIKAEDEREKLLLENIGIAIEKRIEEQHREAKNRDKKIDKSAIQKKIEKVKNLITSHIVKGNDIKLLSIPRTRTTNEGEENITDEREALRKESTAARRQLSELNEEGKQKLLEAYGQLEEDVETTE